MDEPHVNFVPSVFLAYSSHFLPDPIQIGPSKMILGSSATIVLSSFWTDISLLCSFMSVRSCTIFQVLTFQDRPSQFPIDARARPS